MARGASAKRHAQAVFQIAQEADELDKWQEDLDALAVVFEEPKFKRVLESPKVRADQKLDLAHQQLAGLGPLALNLASLLITKGRVGIATALASEYRSILNSHRGLETAQVTTAVSLDNQSRDRIAQQLSEATGKRIILSASVSPDIIGGVVIRIGDQLIDGSTRTKLMTLREALVEQRA